MNTIICCHRTHSGRLTQTQTLRVNKTLLTEREEQQPNVEERLVVSERHGEERWYQDLHPLEKYQPKWVYGEMDIICVSGFHSWYHAH